MAAMIAVLSLADALVEPNNRPVNGNDLTTSQVSILQWTSWGKRSDEIALLLGLESPKTVDMHFSRIMDKTGTSTRAAAVAYALRRGIIR